MEGVVGSARESFTCLGLSSQLQATNPSALSAIERSLAAFTGRLLRLQRRLVRADKEHRQVSFVLRCNGPCLGCFTPQQILVAVLMLIRLPRTLSIATLTVSPQTSKASLPRRSRH